MMLRNAPSEPTPVNPSWGYFRRPALLGPSVGFLAFLGFEAMEVPASGSADGLIWIVPMLVIVSIFSAIPYLLGGVLLINACRMLPASLVRGLAFRLFLGAAIGALIAWPFTWALNLIPSANADRRFALGSMLFGCVVAGAYCAAFLSEHRSDAPADRQQ